MISVAFTVTVFVVAAVMAASLKDGAVNVLGCQSSIKKPMVFAMAGSTAGVIIVSTGIGGTGGLMVPGVDFLQAITVIIITKAIKLCCINIFISMV
jgi:hypothetical protein